LKRVRVGTNYQAGVRHEDGSFEYLEMPVYEYKMSWYDYLPFTEIVVIIALGIATVIGLGSL